MPESTQEVLRSAVLVESGDRVGTGVVISPDGFVLTAAHVVDPAEETNVKFQSGVSVQAVVVRQDALHHVALLRPESSDERSCLPIRMAPAEVGNDLFAIGSPLSTELSFSLTRGIVSGLRTIDGVEFLQTNASINRGNSGGPMIDEQGNLAGMVTWKVAASGVEGIAFGVPVRAALKALGTGPGDETAQRLRAEQVHALPKQNVGVDDVPGRDWRGRP